MGKSDELYERLISPIEKRMIGIVARIVRDPEDAADVFQDVLALIWAKLERIDRHPNPHAYAGKLTTTLFPAIERKFHASSCVALLVFFESLTRNSD